MSNEFVSITMRTDEWEEIARILNWADKELERIGFITSAAFASVYANAIFVRLLLEEENQP